MKKENLSHRAMQLANRIKPAYSSFKAALKVAYSVLRSEETKQQVLNGLASAIYCLDKLGQIEQRDAVHRAYWDLRFYPF